MDRNVQHPGRGEFEAAEDLSTPSPVNLESDDNMDRTLQLISKVPKAMRALLCGLCLASAAFAQNLPDGPGKPEFIHNCLDCHSVGMVLRAKKTPDDWRKNVDDMSARGTDGSKADMDKIVLYLDKYFATDSSAATPSTTPSSTSAGPAIGPAALNSSQIERARRVIADNGCLTCHRIEKQGMYTGPSLNGVGARRTTDQIRTAIVTPHPTLDPGNTFVRLTTADGTTLTGRILSQSDHDVRVIDPSGKITTYSKPELRQFTTIDTNPMPSFEGKITGEDLDDLVRYLGSLPSVDESVQK